MFDSPPLGPPTIGVTQTFLSEQTWPEAQSLDCAHWFLVATAKPHADVVSASTRTKGRFMLLLQARTAGRPSLLYPSLPTSAQIGGFFLPGPQRLAAKPPGPA